MRIFIASTSENLPLAKQLASVLGRSGFDVVRWWTAFKPGDITIQKLQEINKDVDGGIFILGASDKTISRGVEYYVPRDNLLLEYGIFLQEHGAKGCYLLVEKGVKLPTDILGLTYSEIIDDIDTIGDEIIKHFSQKTATDSDIRKSRTPSVPIVSYEPLLDIELGKNYNNKYRMRAIYLGIEGAKGWLGLVSGNDYEYKAEKNAIKNATIKLLRSNNIKFTTIISFGPGDGENENAIVQSRPGNNTVFIPVDINEFLLRFTIRQVQGHAHVPFGIHCDFEDGFLFISKATEPLKAGPRLFTMMGNTFGNLDNAETPFIRNLCSIANKDDHIVLEVAVRKSDKPSVNDVDIQDEDVSTIHLLLNGLAYHAGVKYEELRKDISKHLRRDIIQGLSDVDNTETVVYIDKNNMPVAFCRRYSRNDLREYLKNNGLDIVSEQIVSHNKNIDNLIMLIKVRANT